MNTLLFTTQFKKDLKRYKHQTTVLNKLENILHLLQEGKQIPKGNYPHQLTGNYHGYMECHVENDTLLIWYDKEAGIIKLVRFGKHSELF